MSAFLGPVHAKMYDRVLYQNELVEVLLSLAEEKGWADGLRKLADSHAPAANRAPLDTLIDSDNIHGWLSNAVSTGERRFALVANGILGEHPERLKEMEAAMEIVGGQSGLREAPDAEAAFQGMHEMLLDGMPCDFPFEITEQRPGAVLWQVITCPHAPYWKTGKCPVETYYQLRDAWLKGALQGSGVSHVRKGDRHALRKER